MDGRAAEQNPTSDWAWHVHIPSDRRADLEQPEGYDPAQSLVPGNPNADISSISMATGEGGGYAANFCNYDRQIVFASNPASSRSTGRRQTQDCRILRPSPAAFDPQRNFATENLSRATLPRLSRQFAALNSEHPSGG
jgi:hypothetical protein